MKKHILLASTLLFIGTASAQGYRMPQQYRPPVMQRPMIQPYAGATPMYSQPFQYYAPQVYRYQPPVMVPPPQYQIQPYAGATQMYPQFLVRPQPPPVIFYYYR